jgi:hypothetical protein
MLYIENQEYHNSVLAYAEKIGMKQQLDGRLNYLDTYADGETCCHLGKDFAPYSYFFTMDKRQPDGSYKTWFSGGLIFHGKHDNGGDGSFPTLSVCLAHMDGWSIHT